MKILAIDYHMARMPGVGGLRKFAPLCMELLPMASNFVCRTRMNTSVRLRMFFGLLLLTLPFTDFRHQRTQKSLQIFMKRVVAISGYRELMAVLAQNKGLGYWLCLEAFNHRYKLFI